MSQLKIYEALKMEGDSNPFADGGGVATVKKLIYNILFLNLHVAFIVIWLFQSYLLYKTTMFDSYF